MKYEYPFLNICEIGFVNNYNNFKFKFSSKQISLLHWKYSEERKYCQSNQEQLAAVFQSKYSATVFEFQVQVPIKC